MTSLRTIKTAFKGTNDSIEAEAQLLSLFLQLYREGDSDQLPPIVALALYNDFSELTPDGEDGDEVINKLADRLISVDLLEKAAQLLNYQVSFRLRDGEKARVGTKLAAVYLFDKQPDKCLEVLDTSRFKTIPEELKLERRYLRARAHLEKQEYEEVLNLLKDDERSEGRAIRAEVFWRNKNWVEAANSFDLALGSRWMSDEALSLNERNHVMQMTVSLALLDDWTGLNRARSRWVRLMSQSVDAEPFDILTSNPDVTSIDFRKVASRIAQINTLDAFIDRYRKN